MKKFLCAVLVICMLCGAGMFVGCKDKGGNNNGNNSSNNGGIEDRENENYIPGGWD